MSKDFPDLNYKQISKIVKNNGYSFIRQAGSHEIWIHKTQGSAVTIPHHKKSLKRKTVKSIFACMGIAVKEYKKYLK